MANLERTKKFIFKGEEYQIEVPTVGQYLDIEDQKIINSNGHWFDLIQSKTVSALRSMQIIECISILRALCPAIFEKLNVASYKEIDAIDFVELLGIYQKEISPWYHEWFNKFNEVLVETSKIENEAKKEKEETSK